ncbi:hypothetical protein [Fluviicola sp.]|uniref:hypothetical protein n=1 Tax=Fluviicola sp. TaxID=1917219 RepID=UPI0031CEA37D
MEKGNKSTGSNAKATAGKDKKTAAGKSKTATGSKERATGSSSKASAEKEEQTTNGKSKAATATEEKSTSRTSKASGGKEEQTTNGNSGASAGKQEQQSTGRNSQATSAKEGQTGGEADLSEELRGLAAKYHETDYRHWVLAIVADRLGKVEEVVQQYDPNNNILNSVVEFGRTTDWKADKMSIVRQAATTVGASALQALAAVIAEKMQNKEE